MRMHVDLRGRIWVLVEEGGPWREVTPDDPLVVAPSGDPSSWRAIDRARMLLMRKPEDVTPREYRKVLTDLAFEEYNQSS